MKKVSAIIVCCLLAVALIALPVLAAQNAVFTATASATEVTHGDTFTVTVSVSEIKDLITAGYQISYDATRFDYVKNTKGMAIKMSDNLVALVDVGDKIAQGIIYGAEDQLGETLSGELLVITFKVKDGAPAGASTITCTPQATDVNGDVTCTAVNATVTIKCNHVWGTWADNGANHKRTCTKCGEPQTGDHAFGEYTVTTPAGCDKAGEKTAICSACGADDKKAVEATENHVWGDWTKVDDNSHKRTCTTCQSATKAEETKSHTWGTAAVTTPAGCDKAGEKTQTCTVATCGATKKTTIPATEEHTFTGAWTKVDENSHKRTCSTCTDGTPEVQTKSHTWGTWTEVTPADCKNNGEEKRVCTDNCGAFQTQPIPATGEHGYQTWTKVDDEKHTAVCSGCGEFPKTENHTWDDGAVTTPAGCDKDGEMTFTCTATGCGAKKTAVISATEEHVYGDWTKVDDNNHKRTCTTCQDGTPAEETKEHTWGTAAVTTPAGCDKAGEKTQTCTEATCGATKKTAIEATEEHVYGDWTSTGAESHKRTCTTCTDGTPDEQTESHKAGTEYKSDAASHWFVCVCGEKMNVTAHTYNETKWAYDDEGHYHGCECGAEKAGTKVAHTEAAEGVVTKNPSKTEYGERTFYCTECQAPVRTERIDKVGNATTGDNTLVIPMVILAVLSACGLAVTVVARKRASR